MSHGGKSIAQLPPIATLLTPEERLRVDAAGERDEERTRPSDHDGNGLSAWRTTR